MTVHPEHKMCQTKAFTNFCSGNSDKEKEIENNHTCVLETNEGEEIGKQKGDKKIKRREIRDRRKREEREVRDKEEIGEGNEL